MASLAARASQRQRQAHRPGTTANREVVIKDYVIFSRRANFQYDAPAPHNICWFLEHLADRGLAPTTILNYLSALRTYFGMACLDKTPLFTLMVTNAIRAISITVRHTPRPALGTTPAILAAALAQVHTLEYPHHIKLAVIWMFMAFFRQSNIAPKTTGAFDHTRHLVRGDVTIQGECLVISLKWSKTMQNSQTPTTVTVWAQPGSISCPVSAYLTLLRVAPTGHPLQPLLTFKDGNSMTSPYIARAWSQLLKAAGLPQQRFTLHGLRRGGASYTYHDGGATLEDVMAHGQWASSAVRAYLTPQRAQKTSVHRALANIKT